MPKKILILDTSAFLAGFDLSLINFQAISTPLVIKELPKKGSIALKVKALQEIGKLIIKEPSKAFEKKAYEAAAKIGDKIALSKTDLQLLALAFEVKSNNFTPIILTDDYAIQNVACFLKINFSSIATFGISKALNWIVYCPACFKEYKSFTKLTCDVCGTKLKRKAKKANPF
ncbi:NOB1 family endonuclease [Candidatus Bathyarchaeota archaeon]|nr:NOB1 family endonuclease [Candidatus Bathyarchaeota archaeon]